MVGTQWMDGFGLYAPVCDVLHLVIYNPLLINFEYILLCRNDVLIGFGIDEGNNLCRGGNPNPIYLSETRLPNVYDISGD